MAIFELHCSGSQEVASFINKLNDFVVVVNERPERTGDLVCSKHIPVGTGQRCIDSLRHIWCSCECPCEGTSSMSCLCYWSCMDDDRHIRTHFDYLK